MPMYILHAIDRPGMLQRRLEFYAEHRAFLDTRDEAGPVYVVMSGPLQADDGRTMTGSLLLLEAPDREAVERLVADDPFTREGIWGEVLISRFFRRPRPVPPSTR